jgi:phage replication initiation protein
VYEKGRQLGDKLSSWCRFEVEWRAKDRVLPLSMLVTPAVFLAGSYAFVSFFADVVERVRTFKAKALLKVGEVLKSARSQAGRAVSMLLWLSHGDVGKTVSLLRREGLPKRLDRGDFNALCALEGCI